MNISRKLKGLVATAVAAVGMTAVAADQEAVQLWAGGPYWATSNLGESEVAGHPEYGALYTFDDADAAVKSLLGEEWRVPSKDYFDKLVDSSYCTKVWDNTRKGWTFTGATEGYKDKSIFLPAAGYGDGREDAGDWGCFWSSSEVGADLACDLIFYDEVAVVADRNRSDSLSVRAVRDTPPVAEASVTVDKVEAVTPWDSTKGAIAVDYSLGGLDSKLEYKVAFDVTAKDQTASVTNDAAKLTAGAQAQKVIDTVALFGKQVVDTKAKVKVTLIAVKPAKPAATGVQLWADGPFWAECNVGGTVPGDYGELYMFNDNKAADAAASFGTDWRLPTDQELSDLLSNCESNWETCKDGTGADRAGYRFTGKGDYSSNSIFLPAAGYSYGDSREDAGYSGDYWSSTDNGPDLAYFFYFEEGYTDVHPDGRGVGMSVRAVRDAK